MVCNGYHLLVSVNRLHAFFAVDFRCAYGVWLHMTNLVTYLVFLAALTTFVTSFNHSRNFYPPIVTSNETHRNTSHTNSMDTQVIKTKIFSIHLSIF